MGIFVGIMRWYTTSKNKYKNWGGKSKVNGGRVGRAVTYFHRPCDGRQSEYYEIVDGLPQFDRA